MWGQGGLAQPGARCSKTLLSLSSWPPSREGGIVTPVYRGGSSSGPGSYPNPMMCKDWIGDFNHGQPPGQVLPPGQVR